jgi:ribosome-interacting GTPase 1
MDIKKEVRREYLNEARFDLSSEGSVIELYEKLRSVLKKDGSELSSDIQYEYELTYDEDGGVEIDFFCRREETDEEYIDRLLRNKNMYSSISVIPNNSVPVEDIESVAEPELISENYYITRIGIKDNVAETTVCRYHTDKYEARSFYNTVNYTIRTYNEYKKTLNELGITE